MNRRTLLTSSLAASALAGTRPLGSLAARAEQDPGAREYYQLVLYHLRTGPKPKLANDFFQNAFLPALKRAGAGPTGVFTVMIGPDSPTFYVLITHKSLESFASLGARMKDDAEFHKAGAEFINAPPTDPAFVRMESSLMLAFEGMPHLQVPPSAAAHGPRIFELRTYESHNRMANLKKIEMFNHGEIAIFLRTGLQPVFFGETLVGSRLPNLTYMLTFENNAAREKAWGTFVADPEWKKLSTTPGYRDGEIVSNITNLLLAPAPYSEI